MEISFKKRSSEILAEKRHFFIEKLDFVVEKLDFFPECEPIAYKFDLGFSVVFSVARVGFFILLEWQRWLERGRRLRPRTPIIDYYCVVDIQ